MKHNITYKLTVNLTNIKCPVCNELLDLTDVDGELLCQCGYVYRTSYPYVAGVHINTDLPFKVRKNTKKKEIRVD